MATVNSVGSKPYRVLVPLDGSHPAESALVYLPALRRLGSLHVDLLSVVEESGDAVAPGEDIERERNLLSAYLGKVAADIEEHLSAGTEAHIENGVPTDVIHRLEQELAVDLILLATHARTGFDRWRRGSVTDEVIRGANSSILVVGPQASSGHSLWLDAERTPTFTNILVPLDGSELAEKALHTAEQFAKAFGAQIHLLRVLTPAFHTEHPLAPKDAEPTFFYTKPQAERSLKEAAGKLASPEAARIEVLLGHAEEQISKYIGSNGIDLVALTTHGRSGLARAALGSVTEHLLKGPVPLLVVPSTPHP